VNSTPYSEFGKLAPLIEDPTVEEIWINSPHRIFLARSGVNELSNIVMSAEEVRDLVERLLMWGGRRLDLSHPFVDARLPDGSRLHVAIPEVTAAHWAVNIRKHLIRGKSLEELSVLDVMSADVATFLEDCVAHGLNILVSGSTQAGKTTLLNALVSAAPSGSRVVTIEEVFELKPKLPDCVALQTRPANLQGEGEIPLRRLIKEALRMRPSQLVVGEIREAESLDLLIALNSGIPGMATIHANSARDAVAKLQTLPLLAGENISHDFIAPIVASSIDLVVHTTITRNQRESGSIGASGASQAGKRRIVEIASVTGRIENGRVEIEPLFTFQGGKYESGLGNPRQVFERRNHYMVSRT
jgi:pilus assembly protein CpaF